MKNLSAEMVRFGVSVVDIKSLLGCTEKTVQNKLAGRTEFSIAEAIAIQQAFFPSLRLEYLFSTEPVAS